MSARTINAELGVLRQILKLHRLWAAIAGEIHSDRENHDVGQAFGADDEARLLKAAGDSRSPALLPLFVLSIDTGLRPSEIRRLRHGDLNLVWKDGVIASGEVVVGASKTEGGTGRIVPLTSRARGALTLWLSRFPGASLESYVFPRHKIGLLRQQAHHVPVRDRPDQTDGNLEDGVESRSQNRWGSISLVRRQA